MTAASGGTREREAPPDPERPATDTEVDLDELTVNVIRGLAMDAPQRAISGHPGTAMALAPLANVLFTRVLRVVSMPSWDLFAQQDESYRASVLPDEVPTLAVEAAASFGCERHADASVSIDRFGASAPGALALERLGFTAAHVADRARELLSH